LDLGPEVENEGSPFVLPSVPISMSTYLSEASYRGRLFDQSTYTIDAFEGYMTRFAENVLGTIRLPQRFNQPATLKRFQQAMRMQTDELRKLMESIKADDLESVKSMIKKVKSGNNNNFDTLIDYVREGDFPPILWLEFGRVRTTFLDCLEFLTDRLHNIFGYAPKYRSQRSQRNDLARHMSKVAFGNVFTEFSNASVQFFRMILFIEIWSCNNESELFTKKPWTLAQVEPRAFDEVFMSLHASISSLREAYFSVAGQKPVITETDSPTSWAIRELVRLA
jgi:hypothetical protein